MKLSSVNEQRNGEGANRKIRNALSEQ